MSYILEALKKAQAERQLGNAPTIHAPQPAPAAQPGAAASRRPLFVGLGAGALVVVAGALLMWHRAPGQGPASPAAGAVVVQAGAPGAAGAPVVAGQAAVPSAPGAASQGSAVTAPAASAPPAAGRTLASPSNRLEVSAPPAPPERPAHGPGAPSTAGRAGAAPRGGTDALASTAPPRTAGVRAATPAAAAAPSPEDSLPYLHQLPDAVQRDVPRVSFGGYMYSANPADRLLLVDKALRHEGEEVAAGLVLEKLLPKAAVMNYRGVRYRVAY
jgi:general secretion pathway protein B